MEVEVRAILTAAADDERPGRGLVGTLRDRIVAEGGVDLDPPPRAARPRGVPTFE